jgi:archaellum biogenesis ATPase FlaH
METLDEALVYQFYDVFKNNEDIVEIRAIGSRQTASGYFTDAKTMVEAIRPYASAFNLYFTMNCIHPDCKSRDQANKMVNHPKQTTTDQEIIGREWVLVDLDPKRLSGICSSKEEAVMAYEKSLVIRDFLISNGFYEPIMVFSSSGIHLYLRCALVNTDENTKLVKRFLAALSMLFSDDNVEVDEKVFNAARISRLMGSYSRKGAKDDKERPQRKCRFINIPDEIKVTPKEYFEKIANLYPEDNKPNRENHYTTERFNLDEFLRKHDIQVTKVESVAGGKKYILDHCVFNPDHKGKDAVIFQRDSGEIAYVCFHNSCSHYTWRDVRLMYEPDAYSKKDHGDFQWRQRYYGSIPQQPFTPIEETKDKGKKWMSMKDVKRVDIAELLSIPTGYHELDKKIIGLFAGELTVLSGLNASGKTSWLNCLALNVIQKGFKVGIWSGEMQDWRFQGWLNQMAAGKNYVRKKEGFENFYYAPHGVCDKINEWVDDKLFLYNNSYGSKWEQLFNDIKELVEKEGVQMIVLDNLAALCIDGYDSGTYANQTKFILDVKDYAKQKNIHVILVAHPRKQNDFLRKESISGTADLTNIADNVFLIHRVGNDFEKRAGEFFGANKVVDYMQYSNVLEVAKNRQMGIVDHLVGMFYEVESRRLKNSVAEHIVYGWQEENDSYYTPTQPKEDVMLTTFNNSPF